MWPIWLICAVAVGSALLLTSVVIVTVAVERKRHGKHAARHGLDRNVSQYHGPHLSINDVDITNLPRPKRSLRQSRQESRFYSTLPSEDKIRSFPDGTAESMAEASYVHTGSDRSQQWLSPGPGRSKKSIKLSISAPLARSPMSAITEHTESTRNGSPELVELPTHITPRVTPEKPPTLNELLPTHLRHAQQRSIDSMMSVAERHTKRMTTRTKNDNTIKSRSISMGSIALPPDCPLPPVPEGEHRGHDPRRSLSRSKSDLSTHHRNTSLLNSYLLVEPHTSGSKPSAGYFGFDFGLKDEQVQIIRVVEEDSNIHAHQPSLSVQELADTSFQQQASVKSSHIDLTQIENTDWNIPKGLRHLGPSSALLIDSSAPVSRPVSAISMTGYGGSPDPLRSSPVDTMHDPPSRPVSVSSVNFFRQSVIGPNVPILTPDSLRSKGHKRQNCIRISGVAPMSIAKKRLRSQLDRLAEAEEADEDNRSIGIEIPTISPAKPSLVSSPIETSTKGGLTLDIPKIRQPQARSLRVKRVGLIDTDQAGTPSPTSQGLQATQTPAELPPRMSPPMRPSNPLTRSNTAKSCFVYAGSPASDPTRPPQSEFPAVSPTVSLKGAGKQPEATPSMAERTKQPQFTNTTPAYSPASASFLFSATPSPAGKSIASPTTGTNFSSPRRVKTSLHGPRSAPPPSLRTRNGNTTRLLPLTRQTSQQRSGSPIRKASQGKKSAAGLQQRDRSASQDDIKRSIALLKSLTHAAEKQNLPEINVIRTPSSLYADSPSLDLNPAPLVPRKEGRQRSKTVAGTGLAPPKLRQEATYPPNDGGSMRFTHSPNSISIWEDASIRDDSETKYQKSKQRRVKVSQYEIQPNAPIQKTSMWKSQQNPDLISPRALTFNHNTNSHTPSHLTDQTQGKSPKMSKERRSKLDGFWGDKTHLDQSQTEEPLADAMAAPRPQTSARNVQGPRQRQRSHTVGAASRPATKIPTREGVGLGLAFGVDLSMMRREIASIGMGMDMCADGDVFVNEMERDGIGRLR